MNFKKENNLLFNKNPQEKKASGAINNLVSKNPDKIANQDC
jgi:hypothetical protein